jgi:hypothetical protein
VPARHRSCSTEPQRNATLLISLSRIHHLVQEQKDNNARAPRVLVHRLCLRLSAVVNPPFISSVAAFCDPTLTTTPRTRFLYTALCPFNIFAAPVQLSPPNPIFQLFCLWWCSTSITSPKTLDQHTDARTYPFFEYQSSDFRGIFTANTQTDPRPSSKSNGFKKDTGRFAVTSLHSIPSPPLVKQNKAHLQQAMAAIVLSSSTPTPPAMGLHVQPPATPISTPALPIPGADGERTTPIQIPNKHMPSPNPGGILFTAPVTPPASPPEGLPITEVNKCMESLLHPPDEYVRLSVSPPVYAIDAPELAAAVNFTSRQPLPDIEQLFPWAHGLHPDNVLQLSFFCSRTSKKAARRTPTCYRGTCIVKVGRDINRSKLKGAIMPEEILPSNPQTPGFLSVDPREGFNVRNFHIQVAKFAGLSDIVVYGDDSTDKNEVMRVAKRISAAQVYYRTQCQGMSGRDFPIYSTFVVQSGFHS